MNDKDVLWIIFPRNNKIEISWLLGLMIPLNLNRIWIKNGFVFRDVISRCFSSSKYIFEETDEYVRIKSGFTQFDIYDTDYCPDISFTTYHLISYQKNMLDYLPVQENENGHAVLNFKLKLCIN